MEHGEGETLAGSEVLEEFRSPLGVLLWQALQDVHLWASTAPADRAALFVTGALDRRLALVRSADSAPEIQPPLATLGALIRDPASIPPQEVSGACRRIARWAEGQDAHGTALAFTQAAALALPQDADAALETALRARRRGEEARAESWLRRAAALARRNRAGTAYARAHLELGYVYARRGDPLSARRLYLYALRRARRQGLRQLQALALHGLFDLARAGGTPDAPDALARRALWLYGAAHPRAPELLRAWTRSRLSRGVGVPLPGPGGDAPRLRGSPPARALLMAIVAREAASAGARGDFEEAWERAWALLGAVVPEKGGAQVARTLLELARGAADVEEWDRAEYAAQRALEIALRRREEELGGEVERFLTALWSRTGRMSWIGRPHGPGG